MKKIEDIEKEIIEEFELFDNWEDKYQYLIDLGKELKPLDSKYKTPERLIKGCQNNLWLHSEKKEDGRMAYLADSDGIISRGIAQLLIRVLDNQTPQEIISAKMDFIEKIQLKDHLAMTRGNGLASLLQQMKLDAIASNLKE